MRPRQSRRWLVFAAVPLLIVVVLALYSPVSRYDFLNFDDDAYITDNPHVAGGLSPENVHWAVTAYHSANWHPLTWCSHQLDVTLFGLEPGGHHWTNTLLHAGVTALVFLFFRWVGGNTAAAFILALLWALHPLRVESVAWIAQRKELLSALFWWAALLAYAGYVERSRRWCYALALLCFAAALAAKPMAVTLPCVLLLLDYRPFRRAELWSSRRWALLAAEKLPFFALSAAVAYLTVAAQSSAGAVASLQRLPLDTRLANAVVSYGTYIRQLFWPYPLATPHAPPPIPVPLGAWLPALVLLVLVSIVALLLARRFGFLLVGWLWFLGTALPVVGLVQVGSQAHADRYTYLPHLGLLIMLVYGVAYLCRSRAYVLLALGLPLAALAASATAQHLPHWQDSESLFAHTVAVSANNSVAHNNLGMALYQRGATAEAAEHFAAAAQIAPDNYAARNNLAAVLLQLGRYAEALEELERCARAMPGDLQVEANRIVALAALERMPEALAAWRALQTQWPGHPIVQQLGEMLGAIGPARP